MTAATKQESKDRTQQQRDADELEDRVINLRDQERQVQREIAERRELQALEASQRDREMADGQRQKQVAAYSVLDRQARDGVRQIEHGTRDVARGASLSVPTLVPPALREPTLFVDVLFNTAIAVLSFQRDFLVDLLRTGVPVDAR